MSTRARLLVFGLGGVALAAVLALGLGGLPAFGHYHGVYGRRVAQIELGARHATDYVTALNFDLRAFDTLGEEFILFGSVTGVALLLRALREDARHELARTLEEHSFAGASEALRLTALLLIPMLTTLGIYLALHGALTPGGGFQAGVVLAAGPMVILLAGRYLALKQIAPDWILEAADSAGAAAYTLVGLGGLIFSAVFFRNFLGLGTPGQLLSAGMMPVNSAAVAIEVCGAFLLTWTEFLDQSLLVRR